MMTVSSIKRNFRFAQARRNMSNAPIKVGLLNGPMAILKPFDAVVSRDERRAFDRMAAPVNDDSLNAPRAK